MSSLDTRYYAVAFVVKMFKYRNPLEPSIYFQLQLSLKRVYNAQCELHTRCVVLIEYHLLVFLLHQKLSKKLQTPASTLWQTISGNLNTYCKYFKDMHWQSWSWPNLDERHEPWTTPGLGCLQNFPRSRGEYFFLVKKHKHLGKLWKCCQNDIKFLGNCETCWKNVKILVQNSWGKILWGINFFKKKISPGTTMEWFVGKIVPTFIKSVLSISFKRIQKM